MKYAIEMGLCAMINMPSFKNIGSGIQTLVRGDTQIHRQNCDRISLENRLKIRLDCTVTQLVKSKYEVTPMTI
jgi:phage gp45-like